MNRHHSLTIFNFCLAERRQKRLINTLAVMCDSMLFLGQFYSSSTSIHAMK